MEGPKFEGTPSDLGERKRLLQARIENVKKELAIAEKNLNAAEEERADIWINRIQQKNEQLHRLEDELRELNN